MRPTRKHFKFVLAYNELFNKPYWYMEITKITERIEQFLRNEYRLNGIPSNMTETSIQIMKMRYKDGSTTLVNKGLGNRIKTENTRVIETRMNNTGVFPE